MGKRFDLLIFDWDGTVVDSAAHIVDSIQAAARDLNLPVPTDDRARHIIGLGLGDAMRFLFPDLASGDYHLVAERYRYHYVAGDHKVSLFSGALDLMQQCRAAGFQLAVATGKSRLGLDRALELTQLAAVIHASRCADEGFSKPHPDMLLYLMDLLSVGRDRTLMIGDTTHDLEMARNAGVAAIAVCYGAHPRDSLEALAPLACVGSFAELAAWLTTNA
jgi:phosphoglycolate phosphatase